jgi:pimeloyl-ACP methyl ester carboxylesterase
LVLAGTLSLPSTNDFYPGLILSHMGAGDQHGWGAVPAALNQAGYAVLTYDLRGHGRSEGRLDPPHASTDLEAALAFLQQHPNVDGQHIGLIGASMGGMASVIVGARHPEIRLVIAISSSPDAAGQYPIRVVDQLSPRPFLAVGCDQDPLTRVERVGQLYETAGAPKEMVILECEAHANDIFQTPAGPDLVRLLLEWVSKYLVATG